jgi:hypothetical protein
LLLLLIKKGSKCFAELLKADLGDARLHITVLVENEHLIGCF